MLEKAIWAPSGDNSQPWTFSFPAEGKLCIWNVPGKDNEILNHEQSGSYMAHGALIQNLRLVAETEGFDAQIAYFPGPENCVASVTFRSGKVPGDDTRRLVAAMPQRVSNRKHYRKQALAPEDIDGIAVEAARASTQAGFFFSIPSVDKRKLARALSTTEEVSLQTPELHELFFKDILWQRTENDSGRPGLYIDSLELPPPARFALRFLKDWKVMNAMNKVGLARNVAAQMATVYRDSAAYGGIFTPDRRSESYVAAGEVMQRAWLEATARGLSVQPVTGLMFLAYRAEEKLLAPVPERFGQKILDAYATARSAFRPEAGEHLVFLLRFGYSSAPTARSRRLPPVIV